MGGAIYQKRFFYNVGTPLRRGSAHRFPRGWCSAQRIQNPMIAGGNHTTIPSCHGVALKSRPMTDEECGR